MRAEENVEKNFNLSLADFSKLPHGPEWSRERKARTHFVVRTRTVRLSTGETIKYFVLRKRVTTRKELTQLENEIAALKREAERARIRATDRVLLLRKQAALGIRPRRKKSRR